MSDSSDKIVRMKPVSERFRLAFLGWQCRLRQLAMREEEARPTAGMRPSLTVAGQDAGRITVVVTPAERILAIDVESRVLAIKAENRVLAIDHENRTHAVE